MYRKMQVGEQVQCCSRFQNSSHPFPLPKDAQESPKNDDSEMKTWFSITYLPPLGQVFDASFLRLACNASFPSSVP